MEIKDIPPNVIIYTAGLIERASFAISETESPKRHRFMAQIKFTIHSTSLADYLYFFWGAYINKKAYKDSLHVVLVGKVAFTMAQAVLPYVIQRRNELLIFIEFGKVSSCIRPFKKIPENVLRAQKILKDSLYRIQGKHLTITQRQARRIRCVGGKRKTTFLPETYHNNIFDVFDGSFTMEKSQKAKSIFDDLLDQDARKTKL